MSMPWVVAAVLVVSGLSGCGGGPPEAVAVEAEPMPTRSERADGGPRTGVLTKEQATRAGLDGRADCESPAVRSWIEVNLASASANFYGGYVTDEDGDVQWREEYRAESGFKNSEALGRAHTALCWFEGKFIDARNPNRTDVRYVIVALNYAGDPSLVATSHEQALGLVAPRPPQEGTAPPPTRSMVTYPQPAGVVVV